MSHDYRTDDELRSLEMREGESSRSDHRARKSRTRTALLILLSLVLILGGGLVLTGYLVSEKLGNQIERIPDAFGDVPEASRPKKPVGAGADALNILLAGSDARSSTKTTGEGSGNDWKRGGQRSDTIMIMHITGDRKAAYLISIPRDSWVTIPGEGTNKINAAYSLGGPSLYIQTIEQLSGLRIDHLAVIDWEGFKSLTDALGGVEMTFDESTIAASGAQFPAGTHKLSGEEALDYVRERKRLPGGDFDRIKRQQNFLRSLMQQTLSNGTVSNPVKLTRALDAVTQNLSVDDRFSTGEMRSLAVQMRGLRSGNVSFITIPTKGTGMEGSQSVVYLDMTKSARLWRAVRNDKIAGWLQKDGSENVLGNDVN